MSSINQYAALSGDNSKGVSLCIPFVFDSIDKEQIRDVFIGLNWGWVERIDLNLKENKSSQTAFIHFAPGKFNATNVLEALCDVTNQVKIVYDKPWFWNISLSRHPKTDVPCAQKETKWSDPVVQISKSPALIQQVVNPDAVTDTGHLASSVAELLGGDINDVEYDHTLQPDEERGPPR